MEENKKQVRINERGIVRVGIKEQINEWEKYENVNERESIKWMRKSKVWMKG